MSHPDEMLSVAMTLCAEKGWRALRLVDIATAMDMDIEALRAIFADKNAILRHLYDRLESESLALAEDMPEETVRDKLFAMMIERLDLATPYRPALIKMHHEGMPKLALCRAKSWLGKLGKAAGTNQGAGIKAVNTLALGAIWAMVIPVWFADESPDLSRTMATLDVQLGNAESLWNTIQSFIPKQFL